MCPGKVGQDVLSGPVKTVLFVLLALMLGAGHSACAGVIQNAAPSPAYEETLFHHHDGHGQQDHAQNAASHAAHQRGDRNPAPCGPDEADCHHCKAAQFYKTSAKSELAIAAVFAPLEKAIASAAEARRQAAGKDSRSRISFRWRGPPTVTPVSLKIRLLI